MFNCHQLYIFVNTTIIFVIHKFRFANTPTYALVKLYFCRHTTFQTFQDLFEHTFVYNYVICELFSKFLPTLCNKATLALPFGSFM